MTSKIHQKSLFGAPWVQRGAKDVQKSLQVPTLMVSGSTLASFCTDSGRLCVDFGRICERFSNQYILNFALVSPKPPTSPERRACWSAGVASIFGIAFLSG